MYDKSHSATRVAVHLENFQPLYFQQHNERQALEKFANKIHLTECFFNETDEDAKHSDTHNDFDKRTLSLKRRIRGGNKIATRTCAVHSRGPDRFGFRLLLLYIKGAVSFQDLRAHSGLALGSFKSIVERKQKLDQ